MQKRAKKVEANLEAEVHCLIEDMRRVCRLDARAVKLLEVASKRACVEYMTGWRKANQRMGMRFAAVVDVAEEEVLVEEEVAEEAVEEIAEKVEEGVAPEAPAQVDFSFLRRIRTLQGPDFQGLDHDSSACPESGTKGDLRSP